MTNLNDMPKKTRLTIIISVLLVSMLIALSMGIPNALTKHSLEGNTWQGIIDGDKGEGSFFYRLNFEEDTVLITKQQGNVNIYDEKHDWQMSDDKLTILSKVDDEIQDFNSAQIIMNESGTLEYTNGIYIGTINYHHAPLSWIHFILILVVLMALNELFRNSKWAGIVFYFILPFALLPLWASIGVTYWFKWVKVYSVVFACIWFTFMRYSKLDKYNFAKLVCGGFLALNISEAVMQDFSMGNLPNILNGIAGILSILTLWFGWKMVGKDNSEYKDMVWPLMPLMWIIPYDIWNFAFVYLNFPGSASGQLMVLLSCTIPCIFIKKGTWLQARAYTLAAWFMYYFTFPRFTESLQVQLPRNESLMLTIAVASIVTNLIFTVIFIMLVKKNKGLNPEKHDQFPLPNMEWVR